MKKLMLAAALAALCGAVSADVTSANVVGYTTKEVKAGQFYMVGVQFSDVGAVDAAGFNSFFSTTCAPGEYGDGEDTTMGNAPQIQVLNADGLSYTKYYYVSDAYNADEEEVGHDCWADARGYIVTDADMLRLSRGFWFRAMADGSVTCSGEVSATGEIGSAVTAGQFNIVANPYPVALSLNAPASVGFAPGAYGDGEDTTMGNAPQIQVLNADGLSYTKYYYVSDAYNADEEEVGHDCWADARGYVATGTQVPVGQAFWVKSATAGTFNFSL